MKKVKRDPDMLSIRSANRLAKLGFVCEEVDPWEDGEDKMIFHPQHWTLILKDPDDSKVEGDIKIVVTLGSVEKQIGRFRNGLYKWKKIEEYVYAWMVRGEDGNEIDLNTNRFSDIQTLVRIVTPHKN